MSENLVLIIVLSILLGVISITLVLLFIDKKIKGKDKTNRKESLILEGICSLFSSVPASLLFVIVSSKPGLKELSGITFSLFGFSGSVIMLLRKKYKDIYLPTLVLYLVFTIVGLIVVYKTYSNSFSLLLRS